MDTLKIDATLNPNENDWKTIDDGIVQYNNEKIGIRNNTAIASFARKDEKLIGGITGNLWTSI